VSVRLIVLWVHLIGAMVWIGGLAYQTHVLLPAARRGDPRTFAEAARRARPATWTAVGLVVLSGFYNVTQLGSLERVLQSGAGLLLAAKFGLVIVAVALAAQRDFAYVPILDASIRGGDPERALVAVGRLDRVVLLLALVVIYLGLAVSRA
jgi:copper resistance protein D